MVHGHLPTPDCGSLEPLVAFEAEDDRGGGGGIPSDSKLSMSFIASCISESCSRRSRTSLSMASDLVEGTYSCRFRAGTGIAVSECLFESL